MVEQTTTGASAQQTGYCQVVPMTFQEKYEMYMKCDKSELARMLAERDMYERQYNPPMWTDQGWEITCSSASTIA